MTPARWRATGLTACALAILAAGAVLAVARTRAVPVPSIAGCDITIAGRPVTAGPRPDRALDIGAGGTIVVAGTDAATTSSVAVHASIAPDAPSRTVWNIRTRHFEPPAGPFQVAIAVSDYAAYGVGLTVLSVATDHCTASVWIDVTGRPPVFTALGLVGFFVGAAGFVAIGVNLWRSGVGGGATFAGALGSGLPYGIGVGLLAQQAGAVPLGRWPAIAWVVLACAVAGGLHLARRGLSTRRRTRRDARLDAEADLQSPILDDR